MAEGLVAGVHRASGWSIALGVLMIIFGMLAILLPLEFGLVFALVLGWMAIFNGVAQIIYGFRAHEGAGRRVLEVILGLLYVIAGIFIIVHPVGGLLALTLVIAWVLIVYGIFAIVLSFQMKPRPGWGWLLFDGVITFILGLLVWRHWPVNAEWVVGTLVGISMIASGVSRLMVSLAVRKATGPAAA